MVVESTIKWNKYIKYFSSSPVKKCFIFWREKQSAIKTYGKNTRMRFTHRFGIRTLSLFMYSICPQCLSPRMHQPSNNRYNPNGNGSWQVTPIACGFEAPKRHGNKTAFSSICILLLIIPHIIINNKDLLKPRLIFNFYAHISCKNDWNIFIAEH